MNLPEDPYLPLGNSDNDDPMGDTRNTLSPLATTYLRERKNRGELSASTFTTARVVLRNFAIEFGARPLERLTERFIEKWVASKRFQSWKPATRRGNWSRVRMFVRWLVRRGHIAKDPFLELAAPKVPAKSGRPIARTHLPRVYAACATSRDALIVGFMYEAGARAVEVSRLQIEDVDLHNKTVRFVGKGMHEREEPLSRKLVVLIDRYLDEFPGSSGTLIRRLDGTGGLTPKTVSMMLSEILYRAQVKRRAWDGVSGHCLRHSAATEVMRVSRDIRVAQHLLGHRHLSSTTLYIGKIDQEKVREALEQRGDEDAA